MINIDIKDYEFADVQGQEFIPIYESTKLTDALHEVAGFETDYEFLTKRKMKESKSILNNLEKNHKNLFSYLIQKKDYIVKRETTPLKKTK